MCPGTIKQPGFNHLEGLDPGDLVAWDTFDFDCVQKVWIPYEAKGVFISYSDIESQYDILMADGTITKLTDFNDVRLYQKLSNVCIFN